MTYFSVSVQHILKYTLQQVKLLIPKFYRKLPKQKYLFEIREKHGNEIILRSDLQLVFSNQVLLS